MKQILFTLLMLVQLQVAHCCQCMPDEDLEYDFIGLVEICNTEPIFSDSTYSGIYRADIDILELYKGAELSQVFIWSGYPELSWTSCDFHVSQNSEWIIRARFNSRQNDFSTDLCCGNLIYKNADGMRNWRHSDPVDILNKYREKFWNIKPKVFDQNELIERYPNGKTEAISSYKNGKLHGTSKRFHPSGKIFKIENHQNGKLDGVQKTFSKEGNLRLLKTYKNGKLHGLNIQYLNSGSIWRKKIYHHDKMEREERFYSKSKQLRSLTSYDFATCTKNTKKWSKEGIIEDQYISYHSGKREDFTYNHKGKLVSKQTYDPITKKNSYEKF